MDSLTHIVLGAAIGELVAGRQLGKKALLIGAIANSLPDIDFLAAFWLDTSRNICFHRGITHSILFAVSAAVLLGLIARRVWRASAMSLGSWLLFFGIELAVHIFIDAFNSYGTGWFEPFSHYRVCFNVLFVADPFYSVWPGLCAFALVILRRRHPRRRRWAWFGLLMSSLYLLYSLGNKWQVDRAVGRALAAEGKAGVPFFTTPTPFNSWLWYVVVTDSGGYRTGYRSVFDQAARPLALTAHPANKDVLRDFRGRGDIPYLLRFSRGCYTVGRYQGRLVFNVVRFGQMQGWEDPGAPFVFHYFLGSPGENRFVVQRGRWKDWNGVTLKAFVRRIKGW